MDEFQRRLTIARELSWQTLGKTMTFYLPGMISYNWVKGKHPAVSITGARCELQCDHCRGKILENMIAAMTPDALVEKCLEFQNKGMLGVLISGGCNVNGELPWEDYLEAISIVRKRTNLFISIHSGLVNKDHAVGLRQAGVDQALIDVIGDDNTCRTVYRAAFGVDRIQKSLEALAYADLPIVPHIVCGFGHGSAGSNQKALSLVAGFPVAQLVVVSLMDITGAALPQRILPTPEEVADVIVEARFKMPDTRISLGCARQRGNRRIETIAIDAGINRLALPSDEAIERATGYGLDIRFQKTCCSVAEKFSCDSWQEKDVLVQ